MENIKEKLAIRFPETEAEWAQIIKNQCEIFGDSTGRHVRFKGGKTPALLKGRPVIMKMDVKDAHVYSFKFE